MAHEALEETLKVDAAEALETTLLSRLGDLKSVGCQQVGRAAGVDKCPAPGLTKL